MVAGEHEVGDAADAEGGPHGDDLAVGREGAVDTDLVRGEQGHVRGLHAAAREAGVERAVRVVAGERECVGGLSDRHDPAVGLNRDAVAEVVPAEVGGLPAVAAERRVERAVGVVAGQLEVAREVGAEAVGPRAVTGDDDPAVGLDRDPFAGVVRAAEVGGLPAVAAERRVERAVREIAGQREVADRGASPDPALAPATTILPSPWIATSLPSRTRRSRWSACRRR